MFPSALDIRVDKYVPENRGFVPELIANIVYVDIGRMVQSPFMATLLSTFSSKRVTALRYDLDGLFTVVSRCSMYSPISRMKSSAVLTGGCSAVEAS